MASPIAVAGGTTIDGTTASISVLGRDDQSESLLTYAWQTSLVPSGGSASFSANSSNAAKNTQVTFSKPGDYELKVTITDKNGLSVNTTQRVTVKESLVIQSGSTKLAADSTTNTTARQLTLTSSTSSTWQQLSAPSGGTATITTSGLNTTLAFNKAGLYRFSATSGSKVVSFNINVTQSLTTINVTPGTTSVTTGSTKQFAAAGLDQFNQSMNVTTTWTTTSGTVSSSGLFTAPNSAASATVTATSGAIKGTATVTVTAQNGIANSNLAGLVSTLYADGSLNRADVIQVLRSAGADGTVDATELGDLRYLVANAVTYAMPDYVKVLANNVVNSSVANATYQGTAAGNLAAGSSNALLTKLVDKWFLGADLPTISSSGVSYRSATGPLFVNGTAAFNDQKQGALGDCYFISTLGALAGRNPTAIANMFIDNGDGTFTVRFFTGSYSMSYAADGSISDGFAGGIGTADYVTVNRQLPAIGSTFAYSNAGYSVTSSSAAIWIALAEKAYAQWNETGKSGRTPANSYASIEGGWMGTVDAQVLGVNASSYVLANTTAQPLINALNAGKAVNIGTKASPGNGLVGGHAYSVTAYNAATQTFTLFNPWNSTHPGPLTWAQLQAGCSWFTTATATSSPIVSTKAVAGVPNMRAAFAIDNAAPSIAADTAHAASNIGIESRDETNGYAESSSVSNSSLSALATEQAAATDACFANIDHLADRSLTPEAVDQLFDNLDALLTEALDA